MKTIRCRNCGGKKKLMTLGMIEKSCSVCAGAGEIKDKDDDAIINDTASQQKKGKSKD